MKICLINNLYPPYARGGAERVVETIVRALVKSGDDVFVVTSVPSWRENLRAFAHHGWLLEKYDGVRVYRIASVNLFPYWAIGEYNAIVRFFWHVFDMFAVETAATVRRILRREKPDIVMTHNLKGLGFLIPRTIRRLGIRHIHTVHDVQLAVPSGLIFVGQKPVFVLLLLMRWYERFTRWLIGSPDVVIAPSQWLLNFYTERGFFPKSKKIVLYNPVESCQLSRPRRGSSMESGSVVSCQLSKNALHFLYVGQLERHKGILFLIETIKRLQIADCRLQIDIVGAGSLLQKIKKVASDDPRITIHGAVPREKLSEFYARADAIIVPSLVHENAPTVIFEAFAHGVPVIASRVGGIPEFVKDGETGWLFDAGDADALSQLLGNIARKKVEGTLMRLSWKGQSGTQEYARQLMNLVLP